MSTFGTLLTIFLILIFGIQITLYCFNIEKPLLSYVLTLSLLLMLIFEIILAFFEFPSKVIDVIIYISMGYEVIAFGFGIVIFIMLFFIFVIIYPKIPWSKVLHASLVKYVIISAVIIGFMTYTEVFNGAYSFETLDEYYLFKDDFSQYDNRFWPTKVIKSFKEKDGGYIDTYSVYPWDVKLHNGNQFAYMVVTFYETDESDGQYKLHYYPFTYKLYAGSKPLPFDYGMSSGDMSKVPQVSSSDQADITQ